MVLQGGILSQLMIGSVLILAKELHEKGVFWDK